MRDMKQNGSEMRLKNKAPQPARAILVSFAGIIAVGTLLLMLPISSRSMTFTPLDDALFTATSATCVTGLIVYDTYTHFSAFGQIVILTLIQLGGLGLVTFTTFFNLIIGKKLGLRGIKVAQESINLDSIADLPKIIRMVVVTSLIVEAIGALLLCSTFVPKYGLEGIAISCFLAISAFCNAGFDILGREGEFSSLMNYNGNIVVLGTIMLLIIIGGLGFVVWSDLLSYRKTRRIPLHSKLILAMTVLLVVLGTILFALFEWKNPGTFGPLPWWEKINAALFQSVTCRTAGFNTVDPASLYEITKIISIGLMFVGAAPGSTAGGIKITTVAVLIMTVVGVVRGREDTIVAGRKISKNVVYKALTVVALAVAAVSVVTLIIISTNNIDDVGITGVDAVFETVSAFATVGLTSGVTAVANLPSRLLLSLTMFIGRVGPVSFVISMALRAKTDRKQIIPEGKIFL